MNFFKKQLFGPICPLSKSVYSIHDPKRLSISTQLRVGRSKLNFHKFKHNFINTLNFLGLINDEIEDTENILLLYSAYNVLRRDLLDITFYIAFDRGKSLSIDQAENARMIPRRGNLWEQVDM